MGSVALATRSALRSLATIRLDGTHVPGRLRPVERSDGTACSRPSALFPQLEHMKCYWGNAVTTESEKPPRQHRPRSLKAGSILRGVNDSEVKCIIRNMHENGAELQVHLTAYVPHEFLLYVPSEKIGFRSVLRWREGERVGVMFVGREPKPPWHYG